MTEPTRTALYILIGVFVLLVVISFPAGGILAFLIYLLLLAIVVYFVLVAVRERARARERVASEGEADSQDDN